MSVKDEKNALRRRIKKETEALPQDYIEKCDRCIKKKLLSLPEYKAADRVFAYVSVGREVSTRGIIEKALADGKTVALPVSEAEGIMYFRKISEADRLTEGRFGIPEPAADCPEVCPAPGDLILVPALCCDAEGRRLGHGAGYYDRFLAKNEGISLCLCRSKLMPECVPADEFDIRVNIVLNEN